jgi:hypothetical protein
LTGPEGGAAKSSSETPRGPKALKDLTLYSRDGCHLCEDALARIERLRPRLRRFTLTVLDISRDARLHDAYFERIPVLALDGEDLCEYVVEDETLLEALGTDRPAHGATDRCTPATGGRCDPHDHASESAGSCSLTRNGELPR